MSQSESVPPTPDLPEDLPPAPPPAVPPAPVDVPQFEFEEIPPAPVKPSGATTQAAQPTQAAPVPAPAPARPAAPPVPAASPAPQHFGAGVCPRCGSKDFGKGALITYGTRFRPAYYKPTGLSLFRLHNMLHPFRHVVEVEAQACRSCGLILFQIDPAKLAKIDK